MSPSSRYARDGDDKFIQNIADNPQNGTEDQNLNIRNIHMINELR